MAPTRAIWDTLTDLNDPRELQELGSALFLHRPFGIGKLPGEPDRTPLVSHLLFSPSVARRRLECLANLTDQIGGRGVLDHWLSNLSVKKKDGMPLRDAGGPPRPGVVSLHDASLTADDWIVRHTTRSSLRDLETAFDWSAIGALPSQTWRLLLPDGDTLTAFDHDLNVAARLTVDLSRGYTVRGGVEVPLGGLVLTGKDEPVVIPPAI
jgi:hypothetical protein